MYKRLYRSNTNKILGGVLGGLGEYMNIDPVLVRLLGLLIILATGLFPGVLVYILALFIIPRAPETRIHDV